MPRDARSVGDVCQCDDDLVVVTVRRRGSRSRGDAARIGNRLTVVEHDLVVDTDGARFDHDRVIGERWEQDRNRSCGVAVLLSRFHCEQCNPVADLLAIARLARQHKAHGTLREGVDEVFRNVSWQSVFEGMGFRPNNYSPRVEAMDYSHIATSLKTAKTAIHGMVAHLPTHEQALRGKAAP